MNENPYRIVADAAGATVGKFEHPDPNVSPNSVQQNNILLAWALQYIARGWWVLPLHSMRNGQCSCGKSNCPSPAKHPRTKRGEKDASNEREQIEAWWTRCPDANIGIATGPSGLVVIDVDGPEGHAELAAHVARYGFLPGTLVASTGRPGGLHIYLGGASVPSSQEKGRHIDIRGTTGYVVAAPSNHASRRNYAWINPGTPIANIPKSIEALVRGEASTARQSRDAQNTAHGAQQSERTQDGLGLGPKPEWLNDAPPGPDVAENIYRASLPPWSPHEEARLRSALGFISANIDGRTWASLGYALFDLKWIIDNRDIGFEIWDDWSKTSVGKGPGNGEYRGHADLEKRWRSFARDYEGPRTTTATIYYMARQRGWTEQAKSENGRIFRGDELLSTAAPQRRWLVERWIPAAEVTMLGGDGGAGKTTLALQLSMAGITGGDWLGLKVTPCNVLYISAEDPKDEVHFRLEQITKPLNISINELARFKLFDLAGKDSTVATFGKNGLIQHAALFSEIETAARAHGAGCLVLDAVADFFGGSENERREVRAFIGLLRGLALRLNAAVIIVAHPSVDGIKTGRGYSGSTHWNNAVRSRLYFTDDPSEADGLPTDPDRRVVELAKSNRARRGEKINVIWSDGCFALSSGVVKNLRNETEAEELFLRLLVKLNKQGIHVSPYHSVTYAPTLFAKQPGRNGIGKAALESAMHRLLDKGKIRDQTFGPPSKVRHRLVVDPNASAPGGNEALELGGA